MNELTTTENTLGTYLDGRLVGWMLSEYVDYGICEQTIRQELKKSFTPISNLLKTLSEQLPGNLPPETKIRNHLETTLLFGNLSNLSEQVPNCFKHASLTFFQGFLSTYCFYNLKLDKDFRVENFVFIQLPNLMFQTTIPQIFEHVFGIVLSDVPKLSSESARKAICDEVPKNDQNCSEQRLEYFEVPKIPCAKIIGEEELEKFVERIGLAGRIGETVSKFVGK